MAGWGAGWDRGPRRATARACADRQRGDRALRVGRKLLPTPKPSLCAGTSCALAEPGRWQRNLRHERGWVKAQARSAPVVSALTSLLRRDVRRTVGVRLRE